MAKLNLGFTKVRSPIAGRVGRAMLTAGNLAQADQSVLTTVVSQNPVYVYFQPDEQTYLRYAALSRQGQRPDSANPVRVGLASDTGFPYSGEVNFVNNQVDRGHWYDQPARDGAESRPCVHPGSVRARTA